MRQAIPTLFALLTVVFTVGVTEYLVAGQLTPIAEDLGVSTAAAGQLITVYALGVIIAGPPLAYVTARLPRKGLVLGLLAVFTVGVAVVCVGESYAAVMTGRVVTGLTHATMFALTLAIAATVVPPERIGSAIAVVASGLTLASILGAPLGTLLGNRFGWRESFLATGALGLVGLALVAALVPRRPAPDTVPADELRVFRRARVWQIIAVTALGSTGFSVVFGYIEPLLTGVAGFPSAAVAGLLVVLGLGGLLGNLLAGRATDRDPAGVVRVSYAAATVLLALMPFAAGWRPAAVAAVFALGVVMAAVIPPLQGMILNAAGKQSTMAVTVNVAAFLVGHAVGASAGGLLIELTSVRWNGFLGAACCAAGFGLALATVARRRAEPAPETLPAAV